MTLGDGTGDGEGLLTIASTAQSSSSRPDGPVPHEVTTEISQRYVLLEVTVKSTLVWVLGRVSSLMTVLESTSVALNL